MLLYSPASPTHAEAEVLRQCGVWLRQIPNIGATEHEDIPATHRLASVVDFDRSDMESRRYFYAIFSGVVNRNVIGPQLERNEELLALIACGVIALHLGVQPIVTPCEKGGYDIRPNTGSEQGIHADWLCHAFRNSRDAATTRLLRRLEWRGMLVANDPNQGIIPGYRIDRFHHAISAQGNAQPRITILGPPCEGSKYYNHYLPTHDADAGAAAFQEAHEAVAAMLRVAFDATVPESACDRGRHGAGR